MQLQRGTIGRLPYAAAGSGPPVLFVAGLAPYTGPGGDRIAQGTLAPLATLAERRRLVLVNRRAELPRGMTMADIAAEHAEAIAELGGPVDVVGVSTGGSIAQQLAADHPDAVRRLVLLSTACRLGARGKELQRRVAARLRAGAHRQAMAVMGAALVPPGRGRLAAGVVSWLLGPLLVRDEQGLADMATTIEAEDTFDLAALAPIRAPTLIAGGREDRFYAPELFEETARRIPGSELHLLEGRGHITALSDARLREALVRFLTE